jgi:3-oxoacyl-[acyl-carrier protein] reductase
MNLELGKKVGLVLGGSKGIGLATAKTLSSEGVEVCIMSRSNENLISAQADILSSTDMKIKTYQGDAANDKDLNALYEFLSSSIGLPDIVINNSGGPPMGTFLDHDDSVWQAAFDQHLMAPIRLMRKFAPSMIESNWGRFINISSTVAIEPSSVMSLSATMRAGVAALSKSASLTLAQSGITLNTICPGGVSTDRLLDLIEAQSKTKGISSEEMLQESQKSIPMNRFASPQEIADLAVFLCSKRANYITGRVHSIDGGLTASY